MTASRFLAVAFTTLLSAAALAQDAPAPVTPDAWAPAMPARCAVQGARHDHGADRGTPTPKMSGCTMNSTAASAPSTAKPKVKTGHDHAKFHKLM